MSCANPTKQNNQRNSEHSPFFPGWHPHLNPLDGRNDRRVCWTRPPHPSITVLASAVDRNGGQSSGEALRLSTPLARRGLILPPDDCATLSLVRLFQAQCVQAPTLLDLGLCPVSGDPPGHHIVVWLDIHVSFLGTKIAWVANDNNRSTFYSKYRRQV